MERFCSQCGSLVEGEGTFCPSCGAPLGSAVDLTKQQSAGVMPSTNDIQSAVPMNTDTYGNTLSAQPMPSYPQTYNNIGAQEETVQMSVGQWLGTILLTTCLGLISIVLLFVWAFGNTPQPKKNYCKGMLIYNAIALGVAIVYMVISFACVFGTIGQATGDIGNIFNELNSI